MAEQSLKEKTLSGVIWSAINRFAQQGLAFVFNILIARQLMPSDYGVLAMLGIFLAVAQTFIDSGFANALIRKKDRTEDDYNTVFYFNVAISLVCYILLFIGAPFIARFYDQPILTSITRIIGFTLVINALGAIQGVELTIRVDFKTKAILSLANSVISGIISLILAYSGYGVWALVWQQFASSVLGASFLWMAVRWVPRLSFSWQSFRNLFSYGSKLLLSGLLNTVYSNLTTIIVGKVYTSSDLGEYSKASSLASFPASTATSIMQSVTFPVLASIQDEKERLRSCYERFINLSAYVVFPVMIGLAALAKPVTVVLLKEQWLGMVPFLQVLCIASMWYPVHAINLNLLQVLGRSDYFLRLEIWKKILGLIILVVTVPLGVMPICIGQVISSLISLFINTYYTERLIGYGFFEQMRNLLHIFVHSVVMGVLVFAVIQTISGYILQLVVGVATGMLYYLTGAQLLRFPEQKELFSMLLEKIR